MRNLAPDIADRILPYVRQPVQYVGCEVNARCADVEAAEVTVALAFPDTYTVGISHLGSMILYQMLSDMPAVACDRTYCPQPDAEALMRSEGVGLFGWESRRAAADFDIIGFSLAHEMCATNVLTMLDLAGVPLRSVDRRRGHPLIVAGDAMADSPEPLADFVDVFLPGDGEVSLPPFVELVRRMKRSGAGRAETLLQAARTIRSAYVPRFYRPRYGPDGRFEALERLDEDVPAVIPRARLAKLTDSPAITAPLVPLAEAVHERVVIEIMRGCPNGCRFCQAGHTRLPVRIRPVGQIVATARAALAATGYHEISLLSLSTSDYPHLSALIDRLNSEFADRHVSISLPSLRVDTQLKRLPALTSGVRKGGLTIAVEAATERLRRAIRKNIRDEELLAGVRAAYEAGWKRVKMYFMAGLPGETDADIDAIFELCGRLSAAGRDVLGSPGSISAAVSWFVPKPHTPMQWCPMRDAEYFWSVRRRLRHLARGSAVRFKFHRIERSLLEGLLCRGDRRVGQLIEAAWKNGARLDAWDEHFDYAHWTAAMAGTGLDPDRCLHREIPLDSPLPWDHVACAHDAAFLLKAHRQMLSELGGRAS